MTYLTLTHSEWPKLHRVLAIPRARGLSKIRTFKTKLFLSHMVTNLIIPYNKIFVPFLQYCQLKSNVRSHTCIKELQTANTGFINVVIFYTDCHFLILELNIFLGNKCSVLFSNKIHVKGNTIKF